MDMSTSLFRWERARGGQYANSAVKAGTDFGENVYVARGRHKNKLVPGKLHVGHTHAYIPYDGFEVPIISYEVLVAPPGSYTWVWASSGTVPENAIAGGYDSGEDDASYIARVWINGGVACGKIKRDQGFCEVPHGGRSHQFEDYEVLVPCDTRDSFSENHGTAETATPDEPSDVQEMVCCKICYSRNIKIVFLCGHDTCEVCHRQLETCYKCRAPITRRIRFYELD